MAPTPEERGVADRGLDGRGDMLRAGWPRGYDALTTATAVLKFELSTHPFMAMKDGKRLLASARAKHRFLVEHIDQLQGT
ncbi:MAG: hypothetical protein AAF368_06715, partial [Planctomycetota bacterium]